VVIRQTRTVWSEHSAVCVWQNGAGGGGVVVGYKARWEKSALISEMRPWPNAREQPETTRTWRHLFMLLL
jgi:hypothetical protein